MAKLNNPFNKTFLIISLVLIVVIAGGLFYFNQKSISAFTEKDFPAHSIAVVQFNGEQLIVNESTIANIEQIASQQNVTLNRTLVIERLVQLEVLNAQARKLGIKPTQAQVDAAIAQQIATLESQGLDQALAAQNMTRADFVASLQASVTQDLTLQMLFQQEVVSKLEVSNDQLFALYNATPDKFKIPEAVSVKHILVCYVGAPQCTSNMSKEDAQKSIIAIYSALQNNVSFEELAAKYSTDRGSAQHGGDLGVPITRGQTVPQFETVAFVTQVGHFSMPFETPYGFHILVVYAKQAEQMQSFEQVAAQLKQKLILEQANTLQQAYITGLMTGAKVYVVG